MLANAAKQFVCKYLSCYHDNTDINIEILYNAYSHLSYINLHGINYYENHQTTQ